MNDSWARWLFAAGQAAWNHGARMIANAALRPNPEPPRARLGRAAAGAGLLGAGAGMTYWATSKRRRP